MTFARGLHVLWFTSLVAALAGCPTAGPAPGATFDAGFECQSRADCDGGQVCTELQYCADCDSSGQCLLREECNADSKRCVYRAGWGADCTRNDQCQAGQWCAQGLCQERAAVQLCPSGLSTECPTGDRCNMANLVCEEDLGCSVELDCAATDICNTGSHACVPRCTADNQASICAPG